MSTFQPALGDPEGPPPRHVSPKRLPLRIAAALSVIALAVACATNPVTGKREISLVSEAQEIAMGQQADAEVRREMGLYDNAELQRYVEEIGFKLAKLSHRPNLPWQFAVVDHPAVNAFALPGGFIYITRGILPYLDDEAELAGVLGHEIGHVTARHSAQQATRAMGGQIGLIALGVFVPATRPFGDLTSAGLGVLFMKFGRDDEREADRVGVEYTAKGGWDPAAVPSVLQTLSRINELSEKGVPNWLSTHPEPESRVAEASPVVSKFATPDARTRNREEFLRMIDGIVVGDNPEDGIVRGNTFLHPEMRFALEFPEGWEVINSPSQVAAREPGQQHYMLLQLVERPQGRTAEEIGTREMANARFRRVEGQSAKLGGLDAFVGLYQGEISGIGRVAMRAAHVVHGRNVYVVAGFAPEAEFGRIDRVVSESLRTFRELSPREAADIRPNRLDFYTVRAGDTWQSIAARGGGLVRATDLAIMNHHDVSDQPDPGERIKIVVAG
jgi:predicted Zn-dependent protease